jgi:CspA family cold shock protein
MAKGTVKWFNFKKGYGFIAPESGDKDIFVHITALQKAGIKTLNEGDSIEYDLTNADGKEFADNLKV